MKAARTRALNKKHAGTAKHKPTSKHTGTAHRKGANAHKQVARRAAATVKAAHLRAWSPDSVVPLCTARAFAESLRIALGRAVSDGEVLRIYSLAADPGGAGASIPATAAAILVSGLGGHFPQLRPACGRECDCTQIVGLNMPEGRHTVAVDPAGDVWSWGEPHELTELAEVEEAWCVTWQ